MTRREHAQFGVYPNEAAIPRYQRAWVWGVGALAILLCGFVAGWLFGGGLGQAGGNGQALARSVDGRAWLARQEAVNAQLRNRITELEQALTGDACGPAALEALTRSVDKP